MYTQNEMAVKLSIPKDTLKKFLQRHPSEFQPDTESKGKGGAVKLYSEETLDKLKVVYAAKSKSNVPKAAKPQRKPKNTSKNSNPVKTDKKITDNGYDDAYKAGYEAAKLNSECEIIRLKTKIEHLLKEIDKNSPYEAKAISRKLGFDEGYRFAYADINYNEEAIIKKALSVINLPLAYDYNTLKREFDVDISVEMESVFNGMPKRGICIRVDNTTYDIKRAITAFVVGEQMIRNGLVTVSH
jgi:hypothetical protein